MPVQHSRLLLYRSKKRDKSNLSGYRSCESRATRISMSVSSVISCEATTQAVRERKQRRRQTHTARLAYRRDCTVDLGTLNIQLRELFERADKRWKVSRKHVIVLHVEHFQVGQTSDRFRYCSTQQVRSQRQYFHVRQLVDFRTNCGRELVEIQLECFWRRSSSGTLLHFVESAVVPYLNLSSRRETPSHMSLSHPSHSADSSSSLMLNLLLTKFAWSVIVMIPYVVR